MRIFFKAAKMDAQVVLFYLILVDPPRLTKSFREVLQEQYPDHAEMNVPEDMHGLYIVVFKFEGLDFTMRLKSFKGSDIAIFTRPCRRVLFIFWVVSPGLC
jgi:hypothetical protein